MRMTNEDDEKLMELSRTERQAWITDHILEQGSVQVDELAGLFGVSRMTIHRDLDELEQQGVLRKVRSGATALPSSLFESDVRFRFRQQLAEKDAIAREALKYIEPGQSVFLDEATTLLSLVHLLPAITPLTVISNFLPILKELTPGGKGLRLFGLGGEYTARFDTFTGLITEQAVQSLRADIFFTSVTATSDGMLYHPSETVIRVKRAMMHSSTLSVLLMDHTKFGKVGLYSMTPIQEFDLVIVDARIDKRYVSEMTEAGVKVVVAPL